SGPRGGNFSSDDALELVDRALQLVVDDRIGELTGELALLERLREPLLDLALAFGPARAKSPLELLAVRSRDEDRDAARDAVAHGQGAAGLEPQQDRPPLARDPLDLRPECPRPLVLTPRPLDPLQELVRGEPPVEFFPVDEVVLAAVLLTRPARAGGRGYRQLQLRDAVQQHPREGALPLAGGPGDDEDRRALTCLKNPLVPRAGG